MANRRISHLADWQPPDYAPFDEEIAASLAAFWLDGAPVEGLLDRGLSEDMAAELERVRRGCNQRAWNNERLDLLIRVFEAHPDPILLHGPSFSLWNPAGTPILRAWQEEAERASLLDHAVMPEGLQRLASTVAFTGDRPFLLAAGEGIYLVRHRRLPDGCHAFYFTEMSGLELDLKLEPQLREVVLLKASGLVLKEIAAVLDLSMWQVARLADRLRPHIRNLHQRLCREPAPST